MNDDFWLLHADGASLGNPGHGGAGSIIYDENRQIVGEISIYLGPKVTNNEAEYQGLLEGLKKALGLGAKKIRIRMDSELVVRQLLGIYKVRNPRLAIFYQQAKELLGSLEEFEVAHVRREYNREADALASKAAHEPRLNKKYD